jgi:DNA-binding Lrp family transcriptional regulator
MPDDVLDRIDFEILDHLQNDARLSNKELAARVALAPSSCLQRVRRLRETGVIQGYHAQVNPEALGIGLQAMVAVRLGQHSAAGVDGFFATISAHPAVVALYYLSGATDFLVHVAVKSVEDLRRLVADTISSRAGVVHVETSLVFEHARTPVLPRYIDPPA